jgi:hypothetical protein
METDYIMRAVFNPTTPKIKDQEWPDPNQELFIEMDRISGHSSWRVYAILNTRKGHRVLYIKELSFNIDNEKYLILKNVNKIIPLMYKTIKGTYGFGMSVGKLRFDSRVRNKLKVGEKIEVMVTQIYSFDDEPEQIRSLPYDIICWEHVRWLPWYLNLGGIFAE